MKNLQKNFFILIMLALMFSGCGIVPINQKPGKNRAFELLFPSCAMNSTIRFLPLQENYKLEDMIILSFKNYSEEQVAFPPDSGAKILTYNPDNKMWMDIPNKMDYPLSEPYFIVSTSDEISSNKGLVVYPDVPNGASIEMRVVIVGHIYKNSTPTEECVGAFIDIQP